MDRLDEPRFLISEACRAASADVNTVRMWLHRGVLKLGGGDARATESGKGHMLTLRRVYQIAIMTDLVALGMFPKRASALAFGFTDVGNGEIKGGAQTHSQGIERDPGALFSGAYTWLVALANEDWARITRVPIDRSALETLSFTKQVAVVLPINPIIERVNAALGID